MNSVAEFKRLLRKAKIKYELFENKENRIWLCIERFQRLHLHFYPDGYVMVTSPYRFMKGALGQSRGRIEVEFPAPTVNHLLYKLVKYQFLTVADVEAITKMKLGPKTPRKPRNKTVQQNNSL